MKVSDGNIFDGFMNYQRQFSPEESVIFVWRGDCAEYNFITKELKMVFEGILVVPWDEYPQEAVKFIQWINKCYTHSKSSYKGKWELENVRLY